jgi:hypothetical protein
VIRALGPDDLAAYRAAGDPLLGLLGDPRAAHLTAERWLLESEAKRMVTWAAYEPLLASEGLRILDVGAGFSSLSWLLSDRHDYTIAELCVHEYAPKGLKAIVGDWWTLPDDTYDLVLAVDLFPNADQRLAAFLRRYTGKLRMILTTYPDRWYRVKRLDIGADELLTIQAWDWSQMERTLGQQGTPAPSVFPNGRQIALVTA